MPRIQLREARVANLWVYPFLETKGDACEVVLAIVKGMSRDEASQPVLGETVSAELMDGQERSLRLMARPPDGPMPEFGGPSVTVNANFRFALTDSPLRLLKVTLRGETHAFALEPIPGDGRQEKERAGFLEEALRTMKRLLKCCCFKKCCVRNFDVPANRSGRQMTGNRLHESFNMNADFVGFLCCKCSCCEYRQYVRGSFTAGGAAVVHVLPGGAMDPVVWREDGVPNHFGPGAHFFYGHRGDPGTITDVYQSPNRADGCEYRGFDDPGISTTPLVAMTMNLEFRGEIVDVCTGKTKRTATWTVAHTHP